MSIDITEDSKMTTGSSEQETAFGEETVTMTVTHCPELGGWVSVWIPDERGAASCRMALPVNENGDWEPISAYRQSVIDKIEAALPCTARKLSVDKDQ